MIDFDGLSTCLELFHAYGLGDCIHYLHFCVVSQIFCIQLYNIRYSYLIQIVHKQTYLTHRCNPTNLCQIGPEKNANEEVLHTPQNWSLTIICSLVQYPGYPFYCLILCRRYSQPTRWFKLGWKSLSEKILAQDISY